MHKHKLHVLSNLAMFETIMLRAVDLLLRFDVDRGEGGWGGKGVILPAMLQLPEMLT